MKCLFIIANFILLNAFCFGQDSIQIKKNIALKNFNDDKISLSKYEKEHGHFIQTSNVRMHFLTWGNPSGIPLIWAPGTTSNAYELMIFSDYFVKAGYYIIAIDYYGQGLTPIPDKEVSLYNVADDMKSILDSLKIKKAIIGGWSRGGSIATAFYDSYPQNTLGLILEDGGSVAWNVNIHKLDVLEIQNEIIQDYKKQEPEPLFDSEFEAYSSRSTPQSWLKFYYLNSIKKNKSGKWGFNLGLQEFVSEDNADHKLQVTLRPMAANLFGASTHQIQPKIIYRNLTVPMIIIDPISAKDDYDFQKENVALQKSHPNLIEHKVYENTSHIAKFEKAGQFIDDVIAFSAKIKTFHKIK